MAEELLTPLEVATELKVSARTVAEWLRNKQLMGVKVGGQWRVYRSDLDQFIVRRVPPMSILEPINEAIESAGGCTVPSMQDQLDRESAGRPFQPPQPSD